MIGWMLHNVDRIVIAILRGYWILVISHFQNVTRITDCEKLLSYYRYEIEHFLVRQRHMGRTYCVFTKKSDQWL